MATEANGAPVPAPPPPTEKPSSAPAAETPANAQESGPKLSNAELKAKAKAEKAARRAQTKDARAAVAPPQPGAGGDGKGGKPGKGGKQDAQQQALGVPGQSRSGHQRRPSSMGRRPSIVVPVERDARSDIPDCFSHIPMAKRISTSQAHKDVHPAALALGQQMATFTVRDSIARLKCTLLAFKKVRVLAGSWEGMCQFLIANKNRLSSPMKRPRATRSRGTLCRTFSIRRSNT